MKDKERAIAAIMAVFPTPDHLATFLENSAHLPIVQSITVFACKSGVVEKADITALKELIGRHGRSRDDCNPPSELNFEDLLAKKKDLLQINLSIRALADRINALINDFRIELPKVDKSMLSRLNKEPADTEYKQNVLRSFAFWLGHQHSELGPLWNYETLLKLCLGKKPETHYTEGVRIGFALYSRGDTIDSEVVGWLKRKIKGHIDQSRESSHGASWGKVRSYDITTLYVDFPKEDPASGPASYRLCLMSAFSLAHHITISWALSKYSTKNRFLPMGIVAGEFATADHYLLPILNAKLPEDPVIRIADFVRQCISFSDIRVVLCKQSYETTLFNGESLSIWWVTGVWSQLYFDFIPELLEDRLFKNEPSSVDALTKLLWFPEGNGESPAIEPNAVSTFLKAPQNTMLGMEIAKTLYCRRRFREANEILRIILSINPTNLIARTFRIILLRSFAPDAPNIVMADNLLREAEQEAEYTLENCDPLSEDFYCEYGHVYVSKAMLKMRHMRNNTLPQGFRQIPNIPESIHSDLDRAELLFEKAMIVSPTGIRSSYFLGAIRILRMILRSDSRILSDRRRPISVKRELCKQLYEEMLWQIGLPTDPAYIESVYYKRFKIHDDAISLRAYRCASHFCTAVCCWDTLANPTVGLSKLAIRLLENAIEMARDLEKNDLYIYSFNRIYGEVISPAEFIEHAEKSIRMIKDAVGVDLSKRHDHEVIKVNAHAPLMATFILDQA